MDDGNMGDIIELKAGQIVHVSGAIYKVTVNEGRSHPITQKGLAELKPWALDKKVF